MEVFLDFTQHAKGYARQSHGPQDRCDPVVAKAFGDIDRALPSGVLKRTPSPQTDQSFTDVLRRISVGSLVERGVQRRTIGPGGVYEGRMRFE
ncbi:hypothetical protein ACRBEV_25475 [Methylobacterium phyllosphaerae]